MVHSDTDDTLKDHGQRIVVLETLMDRVGTDMKEQTAILAEMRDEMLGVRGAVKWGIGALCVISTLFGLYLSMKQANAESPQTKTEESK